MKRFLYTASVDSVAGWQTFYIDAETREEADERAREHDTNGIYQEELSVEDIGRLVFDNETETDDFGDFPPTATPTPLADAAAIAEREAFEAWATDNGFDVVRYGTVEYEVSSTEFAWLAWQARAALATTEAPETVHTPISISTDEIAKIASKYNLGNPRLDALRGFVNEVILANGVAYAKSE